ncbi:MAG: tRNA threonylcarbamoyladenosine dehydratase [Oscillospiraceae bacterium]|nr:tRNA threonylcarbamoyladenosine dehydratase [Oscillospiraceae bacterium]
MNEKFIRAGMLIGDEAMQRLAASHVAVFGVGGVGSWCAEALIRSGLGEITLIDFDDVSVTNLNRQTEATVMTVGKDKTAAMAERLLAINPEAKVHIIPEKYEAEKREDFFGSYDYIADCIDLVSCKVDLIASAHERNIPIISALGTGNKLRAELLEVCCISKTSGCSFARVIRKELKNRGIYKHTVCYSPEMAIKAAQYEAPPPGRRSVPGSVIWVPATAGLRMAEHIILSLTDCESTLPREINPPQRRFSAAGDFA